jgi:hypothetical protein
VYWIAPDPTAVENSFQVYCDMSTDGGGWILMATLATTNTANATTVKALWGPWSADWFAADHGDPTDTTDAFSNHDARKFRVMIDQGTILRCTNDINSVNRYHNGFTPDSWDLWNFERITGNGVSIVGPFANGSTKVSIALEMSNPVDAQVNGHWSGGFFYLGTSPGGGDSDSEGLGARYHVASNSEGNYGWVGGERANTLWHLWIR